VFLNFVIFNHGYFGCLFLAHKFKNTFWSYFWGLHLKIILFLPIMHGVSAFI